VSMAKSGERWFNLTGNHEDGQPPNSDDFRVATSLWHMDEEGYWEPRLSCMTLGGTLPFTLLATGWTRLRARLD
jgi:hypothetical protein